jgi:hypothetical protein
MGGIFSLLSNAFSALSGWLGFQTKKLDLKNSPAVQAAAAEQAEQAKVDATNQAIAKKDVTDIRQELAE